MSALGNSLDQFHKLAKDILYLVLGATFILLFPFILLLTFPFYLYRLFVSKVVAPYYRPDIGNPVSGVGILFANEFPYIKGQGARCNNVINFVLEGTVDFNQFKETINKNWITSKSENGELRYPEFQQYVEQWMGYMFWKQDKEFSLDQHVKLHTIPENSTNADCEKFVCNLIENCINIPFPPKTSLWEMHIVHNYKNAEFGTADEKLTTFVFRLHHSLADGFAVMHLLINELMGLPVQTINVATPAIVEKRPFSDALGKALRFPVALLYELGSYVSVYVSYKKTPWHVEDKDKHWKQMFARSPLIPIKKLKDIKNRLNVSFTTALFSCISAGMARSLAVSSGKKSESPKNILMGFSVPLPGHPLTLRNHVTGGTFDACTDITIDPINRLKITVDRLHAAKYSVIPLILIYIVDIIACHLAPVTKYLLRNTLLPTAITNFPGPGVELNWRGHRVLGTDFAAGMCPGVTGVVFMTLSYNDSIRVVVNTERALMTREEQKDLILYICEEVDELWELSKEL